MNKEKQQIKIAEAVGWKKLKGFSDSGWPLLLTPPEKPNKEGYLEAIPDYLNDLNAVHELEQWMFQSYETLEGAERLSLYTKLLCKLEHPLFATASQRAEAFLKTLNLWEE
jgi:hypothetical protein